MNLVVESISHDGIYRVGFERYAANATSQTSVSRIMKFDDLTMFRMTISVSTLRIGDELFYDVVQLAADSTAG